MRQRWRDGKGQRIFRVNTKRGCCGGHAAARDVQAAAQVWSRYARREGKVWMNSIVQGIEIRREGPVWHWIVRARGLSMTGVDGLLVDAVCDAVEAFGQLRRQEAMG